MSETVIILLIAVGVILLMLAFVAWMIHLDSRDSRNARSARALHQAASTITRLEGELQLQLEGRHYDPQPLLDIVKEYRAVTDRRELM